ncbi:MAG: Arm DNA-binding domain-containing protein, partial [Elioraea sp.]|nr:Arm DNA-binding domain-containing protein [Elioraea sp.]
MRRDLNDALIRALRPPVRGRLEVQDTRVPGLMLRVTSSGCMTWAVRASIPGGRRVRATIGRYPAIGLAEARRRALETLARIAT